MPDDPHIHHRHSIRLKEYDYTRPGAYFITLTTYERQILFGEVVQDEMRVNRWGRIVQQEWERLAQRFDYIHCDAFVVMPNHVHGILIMHESPDRRGVPSLAYTEDNLPENIGLENAPSGLGGTPLHGNASPDACGTPLHPKRPDGMPNGPASRSLGALMAQFKSRVTKRIWAYPGAARVPIWQRNYHEHIVRNEVELNQIRRYIQDNPRHGMEDDEYL
jgi:putative transposase